MSLGLHVTMRDRIHEKLAIIDEAILWEGSLNILSHANTSERMNRWQSRSKVHEVLISHRLDLCRACCAGKGVGIISFDEPCADRQRKLIGEVIAKRRKLIGLSQKTLAERTGVQQHAISAIESGCRDVKVSTLLRLGRELRLGLRLHDWYMLPSFDER